MNPAWSRLGRRGAALCCAALVGGYLVSAMAQEKEQATGQTADRSADLTGRVQKVALTSEPVTLALTPRAEFARALGAARDGTGAVALAVEGIEGTSSQPVRINIFVNKPDVTRATPPEDPHFLGYVYLIPRRGVVKRTGGAFDLTPIGHLDPAARLTVTLVPIAGKDAAPTDAALTVGQIYVRRET
jgi:hypothetical protein